MTRQEIWDEVRLLVQLMRMANVHQVETLERWARTGTYLSGSALKPHTLEMVREIARSYGIDLGSSPHE